MKKYSIILALSCFLMAFSSSNSSTNDAVKYFRSIYEIINDVNVKGLRYARSVIYQRRDAKIENKMEKLIEETEDAIKKLKKMGPFEDSYYLLDTTLDVLEKNLSIMQVDFEELNTMHATAYDSYENMENYIDQSNAAMEALDIEYRRMNSVQQRFAEDNGFTLTEDHSRLAEQMKTISELNEYMQPIYLAVFKVEKEVVGYYDALEEQDFEAAEKFRVDILDDCKLAIRKISRDRGFRGSGYYSGRASNMVRFYERHAKTTFVKMLAHYEKGNQMSESEYKELNTLINGYNKDYQEAHHVYYEAYYSFQQQYVSRF